MRLCVIFLPHSYSKFLFLSLSLLVLCCLSYAHLPVSFGPSLVHILLAFMLCSVYFHHIMRYQHYSVHFFFFVVWLLPSLAKAMMLSIGSFTATALASTVLRKSVYISNHVILGWKMRITQWEFIVCILY